MKKNMLKILFLGLSIGLSKGIVATNLNQETKAWIKMVSWAGTIATPIIGSFCGLVGGGILADLLTPPHRVERGDDDDNPIYCSCNKALPVLGGACLGALAGAIVLAYLQHKHGLWDMSGKSSKVKIQQTKQPLKEMYLECLKTRSQKECAKLYSNL